MRYALPLVVALLSLAPATALADDESSTYKPDGKFHGYVGANIAGVLPGVWQGTGVGVEAAIRGGVISDEIQLDFSVSPGSSILANATGCCGDNRPIIFFRGDASAAYLIKLSDQVYWPLRAGLGGGAMIAPFSCIDCNAPITSTVGFVEVKLDVVGALIRTSKHFTVQMEIPSVRLLFVPQGTSIIEWNTTLDVAYVF